MFGLPTEVRSVVHRKNARFGTERHWVQFPALRLISTQAGTTRSPVRVWPSRQEESRFKRFDRGKERVRIKSMTTLVKRQPKNHSDGAFLRLTPVALSLITLTIVLINHPLKKLKAYVPPRSFSLNLMVDREEGRSGRPWAYVISEDFTSWQHYLNKQSFRANTFIENIDHSHPFSWLENWEHIIWLGQCPNCKEHIYWQIDEIEPKEQGYLITANCQVTHLQCDEGEICKTVYPNANFWFPVNQYQPGQHRVDWIFERNAATYHVLKEHSCGPPSFDPIP